MHNCCIIDAAMRLHNFIVDFQENTQETTVIEEMEREVFDDDVRRFWQYIQMLMIPACTEEKRMNGWMLEVTLSPEDGHIKRN